MTKKTFVEGMARLGAVFKPLSDLQVAAYHEALSDISDDAFAHGILRCVRENVFFPKPVEIRCMAKTFKPEVNTAWQFLPERIPLEERLETGKQKMREFVIAIEKLDEVYGTHLAKEYHSRKCDNVESDFDN